MSYFLNTPISYSAQAVCGTTGGPYDGPYTYTWTFSDSTVLTGPTVSKTWTSGTVGSVSIQAYNSSAHNYSNTIIKSINLVANPTSFTFHNASTSLSSNGSILNFTGTIVLANDILYQFGNYSNNNDVNYIYLGSVPNIASVTNLPNILPTTFFGAFYLTSGTYSGKILLFGSSSGAYGYWDIYTNTYTQISSTGGPINAHRSSTILLSNNKLLTFLYSSIDGSRLMTYDLGTNTWSSTVTCGINEYAPFLYLLPSGKVLACYSTSTKIYDPSTNTISAGPTLPVAPGPNNCSGPFVQLSDGSFIYIGASYTVYKYVENGSFTTISSYPQRDGSASLYYPNLTVLPNNFILAINTELNSGITYNENLTRFFDSKNNIWSLGASTTSDNMTDQFKIFYVYNRFFTVNYEDGQICYSDIWR